MDSGSEERVAAAAEADNAALARVENVAAGFVAAGLAGSPPPVESKADAEEVGASVAKAIVDALALDQGQADDGGVQEESAAADQTAGGLPVGEGAAFPILPNLAEFGKAGVTGYGRRRRKRTGSSKRRKGSKKKGSKSKGKRGRKSKGKSTADGGESGGDCSADPRHGNGDEDDEDALHGRIGYPIRAIDDLGLVPSATDSGGAAPVASTASAGVRRTSIRSDPQLISALVANTINAARERRPAVPPQFAHLIPTETTGPTEPPHAAVAAAWTVGAGEGIAKRPIFVPRPLATSQTGLVDRPIDTSASFRLHAPAKQRSVLLTAAAASLDQACLDHADAMMMMEDDSCVGPPGVVVLARPENVCHCDGGANDGKATTASARRHAGPQPLPLAAVMSGSLQTGSGFELLGVVDSQTAAAAASAKESSVHAPPRNLILEPERRVVAVTCAPPTLPPIASSVAVATASGVALLSASDRALAVRLPIPVVEGVTALAPISACAWLPLGLPGSTTVRHALVVGRLSGVVQIYMLNLPAEPMVRDRSAIVTDTKTTTTTLMIGARSTTTTITTTTTAAPTGRAPVRASAVSSLAQAELAAAHGILPSRRGVGNCPPTSLPDQPTASVNATKLAHAGRIASLVAVPHLPSHFLSVGGDNAVVLWRVALVTTKGGGDAGGNANGATRRKQSPTAAGPAGSHGAGEGGEGKQSRRAALGDPPPMDIERVTVVFTPDLLTRYTEAPGADRLAVATVTVNPSGRAALVVLTTGDVYLCALHHPAQVLISRPHGAAGSASTVDVEPPIQPYRPLPILFPPGLPPGGVLGGSALRLACLSDGRLVTLSLGDAVAMVWTPTEPVGADGVATWRHYAEAGESIADRRLLALSPDLVPKTAFAALADDGSAVLAVLGAVLTLEGAGGAPGPQAASLWAGGQVVRVGCRSGAVHEFVVPAMPVYGGGVRLAGGDIASGSASHTALVVHPRRVGRVGESRRDGEPRAARPVDGAAADHLAVPPPSTACLTCGGLVDGETDCISLCSAADLVSFWDTSLQPPAAGGVASGKH